jgi:hypothetical protein
VRQVERLTAAVDDLDRAAMALLPPSPPGTGPSDAELLQTIPGIGPQTAATLLGELGVLGRFTDARALVAYVGFPCSPKAANVSGDPGCRRWARGSPAMPSISPPSTPSAGVPSGARSICASGPGQEGQAGLMVVAVKLLHTAYAMLTHRHPHAYSSLRRQVGLDISWDVCRELAGLPATIPARRRAVDSQETLQ